MFQTLGEIDFTRDIVITSRSKVFQMTKWFLVGYCGRLDIVTELTWIQKSSVVDSIGLELR